MFRVIPALAAFAAALLPATAESQSAAERGITVLAPNSAGMPSCGAWTSARAYGRSNGEAAQYEKWAMGFESGLNWAKSGARGDVLRNTDTEAAFGWVDQFCRERPLETLLWAVVNLDRELARRRSSK